jgi:glutamine amidotransferase
MPPTSSVAIIDYGSGNLRSAAKAFERAARDSGLSVEIRVTSEPEQVRSADRVVLPGVGAFADCKAGLTALPGMTATLEEFAIGSGRPFLGICVGMQLMAGVGREHGDHPGFGWIPGEVVALAPADPRLKIPHMGWNDLALLETGHPLLDGLSQGAEVYFVHSYRMVPDDPAHILATADYGGPLPAIIGRDNIVGTQFHPEKSQSAGLRLISNFLNWQP